MLKRELNEYYKENAIMPKSKTVEKSIVQPYGNRYAVSICNLFVGN